MTAKENQVGEWEKSQEIKGFKTVEKETAKIHVFLISFKKEQLSKKVILLLYCKQTLRPHILLCCVVQIEQTPIKTRETINVSRIAVIHCFS